MGFVNGRVDHWGEHFIQWWVDELGFFGTWACIQRFRTRELICDVKTVWHSPKSALWKLLWFLDYHGGVCGWENYFPRVKQTVERTPLFVLNLGLLLGTTVKRCCSPHRLLYLAVSKEMFCVILIIALILDLHNLYGRKLLLSPVLAF